MFTKKYSKKGIIKNAIFIKKALFFGKQFKTTISCSLKEKYAEEEIKRATEKIDYKNQSKKKKIGNLILLLVNLIIIVGIFVYYSQTNDNVHLLDLFKLDIAWIYLVLAIVMFFANNLIETLKFYQLIYKGTGKKRFFLSLKTYLYGRYYDSITPFSAAGEPFQIFYLNKHKIKGEKATSIPLVKHIFNLAALTILGLSVLIANIFLNFTTSKIIILLAVISTIANGAIILLIILLSVSKKVGPSIVIKFLKLANKMHIIKNYKVTFFKVSRFVKNYQKSMKQFTKSKFTIFSQIFLSLLTYVSCYAIVYFIYLAFLPVGDIANVSFLTIFACMMLCDLCAGMIPLPGGTVGAELSFDVLFHKWFVPNLFTWAMLTWRILTYFSFIVIGAILTFGTYVKSLLKGRKSKGELNLKPNDEEMNSK